MCLAAFSDMHFAAYTELDAVNASSLCDYDKSPLYYHHRQTTPQRDTQSLLAGRAAHTATLEPHRFATDYVLWEGGARRGQAWEAFRAEHAARCIVTRAEYDNAIDTAAAIRSHRVAHGYLTAFGGRVELTAQWIEHVGDPGTRCKARIDLLTASAIVDIKTSRDISPRRFGWSARDYRYPLRMAWYRRAVHHVTGDWLPCVLIVVESAAPHDVAVYRLPDDLLDAADEHAQVLLEELVQCRAAGVYPGAYADEMTLEVPGSVGGDDDVSGLGIEVGGVTV